MNKGTLLLGGAALFLLSKLGKGSAPAPAPPVCPTGMVLDTRTGRCSQVQSVTPATQPSNPSSNPTNAIVGSTVSLATTLATTIAGGIGGGAGGGGGGAAATAVTLATGFFNAGPLAIAAIIIIAVAATLIAQGISQNHNYRTYVETQVLYENSNPTLFAEKIFEALTAKVTKWVMPNGEPLPAGWSTLNATKTVDYSPAQLREIALACLYAASFVAQARNDLLVKYFTYLGWSTAQMMQGKPLQQGVAAAEPGLNVLQNLTTTYLTKLGFAQAINPLKYILAPLQTAIKSATLPRTTPGNPIWDEMTRPFTVAEMRAAAVDVFGADLGNVEKSMWFYGAQKAIFFATIEGYGSIGMNSETYNWTLGEIFGWQAVSGTFWVTNVPTPYAYGPSFWLVDPATGNRIETTATKNDGVMRISQPGLVLVGANYYPPGYPLPANTRVASLPPQAIAYSELGRLGQRRVRRFGSSQCIDPTTGLFLTNCNEVPAPIVGTGPGILGTAIQQAEKQNQRRQAAASALPLLAAGAAALLLLGKKG